MDFWGPVAILLACTGLAVALGVRFTIAVPLGFLVTFMWAANSLGGTTDRTSFVMLAGFFAIPLAIGTAVSAAIGLGLRHLFGGKSVIEVLSNEVKTAPVAESCEQASHVAAEHLRRGGRVRVRCPVCETALTAKRVLSASRPEPDIEVSCRCGGCSCILPFRQGAA